MKYIIEFRDNPVQNFDKENMYKCLDVPCWYISEDTKKTLTPYTEPDKNVKNNDVHLCNSCVFDIPDCPALEKNILYGDGEGFDNVCCCSCYIPKNYYEPDSKDRKAIEDEVWDFVRLMFQVMDTVDRLECFGNKGMPSLSGHSVLSDMTYQEAKVKYEAWKAEKESKIEVGDGVYGKINQKNGVVVRIYADDSYSDCVGVMWEDGGLGPFCKIEGLQKTGRHFSQLSDLLKAMKGEK